MSDLVPERVEPLLAGSLGTPYLYASEIGSTQDVLRDGHHPHGAVAVAEHQTAGRGRSGRVWQDATGQALLFSVLLRPEPGKPLQQLSLVAGLAVAAAVSREAGVEAAVKWPNDVLVEGRKVAGILLEASGTTVICGIGVNVNQAEGDLPSRTRLPATSLRMAAGRPLDRGQLLATLLNELEARYGRWLHDGLVTFRHELEARNALRGRAVVVDGSRGIAGEIAPDGRLEVALDDGETVLIESGEVETPETG
jgi:BirA family biotin operon repressor/biotin-[acetyl-CoA-carboxylase] ligase